MQKYSINSNISDIQQYFLQLLHLRETEVWTYVNTNLDSLHFW